MTADPAATPGQAHGVVRIACGSAEEAMRLQQALAPDNGDHLLVRVEGAELVLEAGAATPMGLLRTLDDALACLRATGLP